MASPVRFYAKADPLAQRGSLPVGCESLQREP